MFRPVPALSFLVALCFALSACALPSPREREAARLAEYEQFVAKDVESFQYWRIDHWERLGPATIAVWTSLHDAFLLDLRAPCSGLEFANSIGLSATNRRVHRRFDTVQFEQQHCRIDRIREIDGRALRTARLQRGEADPEQR